MVLSYRHGFHTGNIGDVLKQLVLHDILNCATAKRAVTANPLPGITYIDTHAGSGLYRLHNSFGRRKREYTNGIMPLLAQQARTRFPELRDSEATMGGSPPVSPLVESYADKVVELNSLFTQPDHKDRTIVDYWAQFVGRGDSYDRRRRPREGGLSVMTGTAMLALDKLNGSLGDKAVLMDLHRTEFKTLSENVPGFLKVKGLTEYARVPASIPKWSPPDVWVSRATSGLDDPTLRLLLKNEDTDAVMSRPPTTKPRSQNKKRWQKWAKKDPEGFKRAEGNYNGGFVSYAEAEEEEEEEFKNNFEQGVKVPNAPIGCGTMEMRIAKLQGGYDDYITSAIGDVDAEKEEVDEPVKRNQVVMMVDPPYEIEDEYFQVMAAVRAFVSCTSGGGDTGGTDNKDSTMILWIPKKYGDSEDDVNISIGRQLVLDIQEHLTQNGIASLTAVLENPLPTQGNKSQLQPHDSWESSSDGDEAEPVVRGMAGSWVVVVRPPQGMYERVRHAVQVLTSMCATSAGKWVGDVTRHGV
jgi:23S rRNA A2030 N6-methylase RlmJ